MALLCSDAALAPSFYSMNTLIYQSWTGPLGAMVIAARGEALAGVWFRDQKYFPHISEESGWQEGSAGILDETIAQLQEYFAGSLTEFSMPLDPAGTAFQRSVWEILVTIPYGETTTYGAIATQLGNPKAAHAVGGAVGHNPISVVIPCHRALGSTGGLTGYAGGLDRKTQLLDMENGQLIIPLMHEKRSA